MTTLRQERAATREPTVSAVTRRSVPWGRLVGGAVLPCLGLVAWQAVIWLFAPRAWLLPTPAQVADVLWNDRGRVWFHAESTIRATLTGLVLALVVGLVLAAAISASRVVDRAVYPWIIALQAIPLLALAPPMTVWLDYTTTQVLLAMIVCIFPIVVSGVDGLRSADPQLTRMARTLGATRAWTWRHVALPGALPSLMTGLRMAAVFSVSGAVVAEYVAGERGLGYLTEISSSQFESAVAFAAIAWLAAIGLALFLLVCAAERVLVPHRFRPTRNHRRPS